MFIIDYKIIQLQMEFFFNILLIKIIYIYLLGW